MPEIPEIPTRPARRALAAALVATALVTTALVTGTGAASAQVRPADAAAWTGQFTGYDSADWQSSWGILKQSWGSDTMSAVSDPSAPGDGSALQVGYPAGSSAPSCTDCPATGGGQFYTDLNSMGLGNLADSSTLDLKYYVKFPAGYDWGKAGKLPGLYGGEPGEASGGNHGSAWSTRFMWRGNDSAANNGEVYLYTPTNSGPTGYGVDLGVGDWTWTADGNWHSVEQLVDRGSGDITVWFDGQQVSQDSGAASGIGSIPFHGIFFSTFYGGHDTSWGPQSDQQAYFADFSLSPSVQH